MDTMDTTLAPTPETASTTRQRRRWPLVVGTAALAGVIGLGVGYLAGSPQRADLTDQRDVAQAALVDARADLDTAEARLTAVEEDLAGMIDERDGLSKEYTALSDVRDQCAAAAVAGSDLVTQWENLWADFDSFLWSDVGSDAEAEITTHMNEQWQKMEEQHTELHTAIDSCTIG